jgi:catechol 2,3-dioxygenase-like lactoylglutathione lyase family enzyme
MSVKRPKLPALSGVGVVVKDIDKAIEYYSKTFGIGPFRTILFSPEKHWVNGKPFPATLKLAFASLGGSVELELLQPLSEGPHKDFLDTHGEGIQHIGFNVDNYDEWMSYIKQEGIGILTNAEGYIEGLGYVRAAYLDPGPEKPGNTLIEISEVKPKK